MQFASLDQLKFAHKGALLVAVPLVLSIMIMLVLWWLVTESEMDAQRENRHRAVLAEANDVGRALYQAGSVVSGYMVSHSDKFKDKYYPAREEIAIHLEKLNELVKDNPQQKESMSRLNKLIPYVVKVMDLIVAGRDSDLSMSLFSFADTWAIFSEITKETGNIVVEAKRSNSSWLSSTEWRATLRAVMIASMLLCVGVSALLALLFSRRITDRLHILIDNTKLLQSGEPLMPKLQGADEISDLDSTFHVMSEALRLAQSEAQENANKANSVIDNMPANLMVVNTKGELEHLNKTAQETFKTEGDPVGMAAMNLFPTFACDEPDEFITLFHEKYSAQSGDITAMRFDKSTFPAEVNATQFRSGGELKYLIMALDVSDRYEAELLKAEIVSMVSHDLRAPLTSLKGTLALLESGTYGNLSEKGLKTAARGQSEIDRLVNLTNSLLDVQALRSGNFPLELKKVLIMDLFQQAKNALQELASSRKVTIETAAPDNCTVYLDQSRMVQVIVNLVSNAIKYSPPDTAVRVSAEYGDDYLQINVTDSGPGIPKELQERIFDKYKRADKSHQGFGLGLHICKMIVEAHRGSVGIESEEGKGSTFWIRLPLV